ncbi:TonB-dependent receptor [Pseudoalteromonas sp. S4389]|uniref:TonB-dependent receptor n=2 Tax=unclassified Pseudoalteromonas TaxID=194690 RepID=UPI00110857DD|nr:TonB-dependent receptor [Pseudoalteromonas sp. S4389]TMO47058.1 TonB-dependent receptor [Pseudoalteromonas sp. S4389]
MATTARKTYLSVLISSILASSVSFAASAQQQENNNNNQVEEDVEVIEVTGIRSSIKESNFRKREATTVVDVVVADDIGKFPDENLAEALQRIPGITITRNGGEGQNILVRGLGGGYNITTLNGRKLASENSGRDFNFDTIASELVGALQVYKSPEARLIEGGIGAVVDIETRKPLDQDGFTLSASAKGIYESRTGDVHPHASFIIGDNFNDDTFGVLFSGAYSKKTLRADTYSASGFFDEEEGWGADSAGVPVDMNGNGEIDGQSEIFASKIPSYMYFANAQDVRERVGATLAMQWRPTDTLDINFDALYSRYNTDGHRYQIGFVNYDESWTPGTPVFTDAQFDDSGRVVSMTQTGNTMVELLNLTNPRKTDTYQFALNAKWYPMDGLTLAVDVAHSKAKNENGGDNRFIVARGFIDSIGIDYTTGNMLPDVTLSPGLTADQSYGAHYSRNTGTGVEDTINDFKFTGTFLPESDLVTRIDFGLTYLEQTKSQLEYASKNASQFSNGGQYLDRDGYEFDDSTVVNVGDFNLFEIPSDVFVEANFDNFLAGESSITPEPWPSFDYDKLLAYYRSINAEATDKSIVASLNSSGTYEVTEEVLTAYAQVTLESTVAKMPYMLNVGIRGSQTEVSSKGSVYDLSLIDLQEDGKPLENGWRETVQQSFEGDYSNILPSMNFKLSITDDLIYRFSAAQVISRPSLAYLRPWLAPNFDTYREGLPQLSMGDSSLTPEEANQADMTLEWYFEDSSSLSGGVFVKDLKSFIDYVESPVEIEGVRYFASYPGKSEYGATIKGAEFAYQQSLENLLPEPFNGLGFQLNYTYVDSSYDEPELKESGLPFRGMSKNSYNAVVYYEQYGFQARLAYNWRSKFLSDPDAWGGPYWISDYGQLDASMSYNISDQFTVFAEATNLTNERYWGYTKRTDQVSYLERFGTQVALGIRASF